MDSPIVYDKAKYHFESIEQSHLPEIHAYIHTGMYLGWLIDNDMLDKEFIEDFGEDIQRFKNREITASQLYALWDGALIDDMLNEEGNHFSKDYFDFETGQYIHDYIASVAEGLPTEFHVKDNWENYEIVKSFVSRRYSEWKKPKATKSWWQIWK